MVLGSYFSCTGHPAGEVRFEGLLVDVAVCAGLAGDFEHDVGVFVEEEAGAVDEAGEVGAPVFLRVAGGLSDLLVMRGLR